MADYYSESDFETNESEYNPFSGSSSLYEDDSTTTHMKKIVTTNRRKSHHKSSENRRLSFTTSTPVIPVASTSKSTPTMGELSRVEDDMDYGKDNRLESKLVKIEKTIKNLEKNQKEMLKIQQEILEEIKKIHSKGDTRKITSKRKSIPDIPSSIRDAIRDAYNSGKDSGLEWTIIKDVIVTLNIRIPNSEENKQMTQYINTFVKDIYPDTADSVIQVATERYFQTLKEKQQRDTKGKSADFKTKMMLYQRRKRKLNNRREALRKKASWEKKKKDKISDALVIDMMSSKYEEDSGDESFYTVRKLCWRSEKMNNYIKELDSKVEFSKSKNQNGSQIDE